MAAVTRSGRPLPAWALWLRAHKKPIYSALFVVTGAFTYTVWIVVYVVMLAAVGAYFYSPVNELVWFSGFFVGLMTTAFGLFIIRPLFGDVLASAGKLLSKRLKDSQRLAPAFRRLGAKRAQ